MERRLGRGLGSLLGGSRPEIENEETVETVVADAEVLVSEIRPNPHQPRKTFNPEGLEELCSSIQQHGVLQPIVVRRTSHGFELIAGERRLRASKLADLERIPAVIKEVSDEDLLELALVENVQRRDLDAMEKALGYQKMMGQLGLTQEQVAGKVGLKRATVANHLRLLELPPQAQEALVGGLISMGHARALLGLKDKEQLLEALGKVVREGLSVRQAEERVKQLLNPASSSKKSGSKSDPVADDQDQEALEPWVADLQRRMQIHLGTRVKLHNRDGYKGRISIEYYGRDDLERLIKLLAPEEEL